MTKQLVIASLVATVVMSAPVIMISIYTHLPGQALYSVLLWPALQSTVPMILYHTLPVLAAVAIIWCYGRFSSDGTLVALHMAGRSYLSVRAPGLLVATCAMIAGYLMSCVIAPHTSRHLHDVLYSIRYNLTPSLLKVGSFNEFGRKGDVVFVERRIEGNKFANVFILRKDIEGEERAYRARHALFEQQGDEQVAVLVDGSVQVFSPERKEVKAVDFDNIVLPLAKAASVARGYRTVDELATGEFLREGAGVFADPARARSWMREALNRFLIPGLVFTHVLLGLELLGFSGMLTDRKRDSIAVTCAGIAFIHFGIVVAIEQVGVNIYWVWVVGGLVAAELAAAAALVFLRTAKGPSPVGRP